MAQLGTPKSFLDEKIALYDFLDPSIAHDRVLIVEDKTFYVLSGLLSLTSEFFNTMFNGSFREKNETEIVLPDVVAVDFQNFLSVIYPADFNVNETNLRGLMKLSARFLSPIVWQQCVKYLEPEETFKKFQLSDLEDWLKNYNSKELKDRIDNHFAENIASMEEKDQFEAILMANIYVLEKFASGLHDQLLTWFPEKLYKFYIYLFKKSQDVPIWRNFKKDLTREMKRKLSNFNKDNGAFEKYSTEDLEWFEKVFIVLHNDNQLNGPYFLKLMLRLAKEYQLKDLKAYHNKDSISNKLSEKFLLKQSFKNVEMAVTYNLTSLKNSMANYLKATVGIPKEVKNILIKSSLKTRKFAIKALQQGELGNI